MRDDFIVHLERQKHYDPSGEDVGVVKILYSRMGNVGSPS